MSQLRCACHLQSAKSACLSAQCTEHEHGGDSYDHCQATKEDSKQRMSAPTSASADVFE